VETSAGLMVVKRYDYTPLRQRIEWLIGTHPLQDELKAFAFLKQLRFPIARIMAQGMHDGKGFLVTQFFGESLQGAIYRGRFSNHKLRRRVAHNIGSLMGSLWLEKVFLRDFKAANILVDSKGNLAIIDPGRKQTIKRPEQFIRMANLMAYSTKNPGATRTDHLYAWRVALDHNPDDVLLENALKAARNKKR
jgi:serine/threonine protein kinase